MYHQERMTTIAKEPQPLIPAKDQGLSNRLQDTGWGRATAHLIPFYGLIYAITRRTITPGLYVFGGSFIIGMAIGLATPNMTEQQSDRLAAGVGLVFTPLLAKAGIDQSRKYAEKELS